MFEKKKANSGDHSSGAGYVDFTVARNKLVTRGIFRGVDSNKVYENKIRLRLFLLILSYEL